MNSCHDAGMYDDLKNIVNSLDEVERQVYRQQSYAADPNLKTWCSVSGREIADIKSELQSYIRKAEEAGLELR